MVTDDLMFQPLLGKLFFISWLGVESGAGSNYYFSSGRRKLSSARPAVGLLL